MNRDNDSIWKMATTQLHSEGYRAGSDSYDSIAHKRYLALKKNKEFCQRMTELSKAKPHTEDKLATGFRQ